VPADWATYFPSWVEFSVVTGAIAGILLVLTLYSKLFPIMSVWEVEEGAEIEETKRLAAEMRSNKKAVSEPVQANVL